MACGAAAAGSGEVKQMAAVDWRPEDGLDDNQEQGASDLIDALWMSDDQADHVLSHTDDPFQEAWNATVLQRALHPRQDKPPLVFPAAPAPPVPKQTKAALDAFRQAFPLVLKPSSDKEKKKKGRQALTYANFVTDDT